MEISLGESKGKSAETKIGSEHPDFQYRNNMGIVEVECVIIYYFIDK